MQLEWLIIEEPMRLKLALRHGFLRAFYRPSQWNAALGSKTNESYVLD